MKNRTKLLTNVFVFGKSIGFLMFVYGNLLGEPSASSAYAVSKKVGGEGFGTR